MLSVDVMSKTIGPLHTLAIGKVWLASSNSVCRRVVYIQVTQALSKDCSVPMMLPQIELNLHNEAHYAA